jgi:hypothetical protein
MSKKAAEQHEHAARHHKEATQHHEAGKQETAAHHAHLARGHPEHAIWVGFVVLCLVCGFNTSTTSAQAVYGSILGTVTDTQGAAVPGGKVTVTSINKGTTDETTTNESGNYSVTHLIPDTYEVRIEAPGFKVTEIPSVQVSADIGTRVDATMQVGAVTQSVEVTSEVPQLKTDRADVATSFTSLQVEDLPIYNRNFTTFQLLAPGNQRMNGWNHAASENPQGSQQILTQGQHFAGTGFELDGTDNQDPILGIIVINPNLEAINEVKIASQDYDAEFGKAIGAIVTTQTKSGTNDLHGSIFDFQRSNSNFARNPFTQATGFPAAIGTSLAAPLAAQFEKTRSSFLVTIRDSAAILAAPDKKEYRRRRSVLAILATWVYQFMIRIRRRMQPTRLWCWMQMATPSQCLQPVEHSSPTTRFRRLVCLRSHKLC